jgi:hypothetical protein
MNKRSSDPGDAHHVTRQEDRAMSTFRAAVSFGAWSATVALRPVSGAYSAGRRLECRVRDGAMDRAGDAVLVALDVVLASPRADDAVDRILASPFAERAVGRAFTDLLAGNAIDLGLDRAVAAGVPQRIADRLLEDGLAEQLVERVLDGPELERMVAVAFASERVEAAVVSALESAGLERLIARVLESRALWAVVDEVAQSPAVTDAITQQGLGMADDVAGAVRDRSRAADAWLERAARRVLRRTQDGGQPPVMPQPQVP